MISVMHVISGLDLGGAEAMLVRLLQGLDRESFSQSVVSLTTRGAYGDQVEASGMPLLTLGMGGVVATPRSLTTLCRAIKEQRPEIVQTWLYHADLLGLVAARLTGDASVAWNVRCAGLGPGDVSRSTRSLIWLLAKLSSRPDAILFNSTAGRESHRAIGYHPSRSEVIPNGFDLKERRPDPQKRGEFRDEIGVESGTFLVGMIARSHRMKDQSTFLAAAARLKSMRGAVRFVLVGLGHEWTNTSLVADIDEYGLRDRIHLLGLRQDIPRVMAGLDCLVSTSTSEGFPNVIGEAMACGVPSVATDAGDSRLIVGDTGTIVPIGDVAGVVAGVSRLMEATPEERRSRAEQCRRRIVENFNLSDVAARYAEFYRELNDRRLARRPASAFHIVRGTAGATGGVQGTSRSGTIGGSGQEVAAADAKRLRRRFSESSVDVERKEVNTTRKIVPLKLGRQQRMRLLRWVSVMAAAYVMMFYTPLVWATGNYLVIRQEPRPADAIAIFSGNGESSYINSGYQRRARDAAQYYKAGYAPMLVISSGIQQTFAEVEIIRALLLSQGVPLTAMHIVPEYPASTYQNVEVVSEVLKQRGFKSILFVTAPYHSRRASMIWRKVAPDIKVTTVPVIDTPPASPQWRASVDQIEVIAYEYLAIAYNRLKGWL